MAYLSPKAKTVVAAVGPGLFLTAVYIYALWSQQFPSTIVTAVTVSPFVLFAIAAGVAWFFNQHKVVYVALLIAVAYAIAKQAGLPGADPSRHEFVLGAVAFFLPLNMLLLVWQEDFRKLFTLGGVGFVVLLWFEITSVYWLHGLYPEQLSNFILFPTSNEVELPAWLQVPIPATVTYLIGLGVLASRLMRRFNVMEAGMMWALVSSYLAFNTQGVQPDFSVYMTLSTLILTVALLQTWYDFAYLDQLTNLPGRLAINEALRNLKDNYVVAMVDVDHFKKFNDTYGHDVGDQILKLVASRLRSVSGGGMAYRWGGEEFMVIFPNKRIKDAFNHLNALRETIEECRMILRSKTRPANRPEPVPKQRKQPLRYINVTVSIGIAEKTEELATVHDVVKAADQALYRAKERGRNRLSL